MLFDDAVEAVLAVLEMVLAIVKVLPLGSVAPEGSVALPATTLRVGSTSRGDEAAPCGVSALSRRAALWQEALASALRRVRVLC